MGQLSEEAAGLDLSGLRRAAVSRARRQKQERERSRRAAVHRVQRGRERPRPRERENPQRNACGLPGGPRPRNSRTPSRTEEGGAPRPPPHPEQNSPPTHPQFQPRSPGAATSSRPPAHSSPHPCAGSRCEGAVLGLGASACSDRSKSGAAPVAYRVTAVTPAIHPCTPRALVRTSYTRGTGQGWSHAHNASSPGAPHTPGAGGGCCGSLCFPPRRHPTPQLPGA